MSGVSLASDRRARIPFAVVGVLLLVSSLALAATLSTSPAPSDTAVERTLTEVTAGTETAVRDGVATASRRAAAAPVVTPADTPVGRALGNETAFRDSLRLRVYLQVRADLARLSARSERVEATASLPSVGTTAGYERAIDRVHVERAGENDTALRATVEGITVRVRRGERVVTRRNVSRTVVVPTPVLYVHDRMATYETRVTNGLDERGLTRQLTARLYPIAWARGYAQYGGAPVANVVANRHVSLATNAALLSVQRSVFGRSDPEGRQALVEATAVVGIRDIVAGSNSQLAGQILNQVNYRPASQNITTGAGDVPGPDDPMRIGVNRTADRAFGEVGSRDALDARAAAAYTVDAGVIVERDRLGGGRPSRPESPGPGWERQRERTDSEARIVGGAGGEASVPEGWHVFDRFERVAVVTHTRIATWTKGRGVVTTTSTERTERVRVRLAFAGRHRNTSIAPGRGIETAHSAGASPLGGRNLADIRSKAADELFAQGRDEVARDAAAGRFQRRTIGVTGDRPRGIAEWIARDLRRLRERVRDVSVETNRSAVGSFRVNPAQRLRTKLRQRRARLVDAPETYDSAATRARVAARVDFLDAVDRRLAAQAGNHSDVEAGVREQLREIPGGSLAGLRRAVTASGTNVSRVRPTPVGPAGPVRTRVEAQPQYLTLASVSESNFPAVDDSAHPLVARNVNVFTVPYGNAVNEVVNVVGGGRNRASLSAAAKTLAAANETDPPDGNETLEAARAELRVTVAGANQQVVGALTQRVQTETGAESAASERIVTDAMARWNTTAARALALSNYSATSRIAAVAGERRNLSTVEEDWLRLRLARTATTTLASPQVRPNTGVVNRTANSVRSVAEGYARSVAAGAVEQRVQTQAKRRLGARVLPSGLPVAPPLTGWYATTNIWWVTVEGEYARFAVTASHGSPTDPGATVRYVREDSEVTRDVDGDGAAERLGNNTEIEFRADTGVLVVVPPQPRGVGDKDGNAVESSAGWPDAG